MINYIEGSIIGVPAKSPSEQNPFIWINTYTGNQMNEHPEGVWTAFSTAGMVPEGVKAVRLDGMLVITHGTTAETADVTVAFRSTSDINPTYVMQTIEASIGNGQRSCAGTWVALDSSGAFEVKWTKSTAGQWPTNSCYAIALWITAYIR